MKRLLFAALFTCCATIPTSPTNDQQFWWDAAREEMSAYGLRTLGPEQTIFIPVGGFFFCGGNLAAGCYSPSNKTITYSIETPHVLKHEAAHAMLHQLGYPKAVYHCIPAHHHEPMCAGWPWVYGYRGGNL